MKLLQGPFAATFFCVVVAGCSQAVPQIAPPSYEAPGAVESAEKPAASSYHSLHGFGLAPDGTIPKGGLVDVDGSLYGTTSAGGTSGDGTVFTISTNGAERIIFEFAGGDGTIPLATLLGVNGMLFGTAQQQGGCCGVVFSLTRSGSEKVLHAFSGGDGAGPQSPLVDADGPLYGTTYSGGVSNLGTAFSVDASGNFRTVYSFGANGGFDGEQPAGGLTDVLGTFYGTTQYGGRYGGTDGASTGYGTAFRLTTSGAERVIHQFGKNASDGIGPVASLIDVKGVLYGTTPFGGTFGGGTVFSLTTSGTEHVLHSFGKGVDGNGPVANLIDVKGVLYGTTQYGGAFGAGTVFSLTTSGSSERVLHSFGKGSDGVQPLASLLAVHGQLYGTTSLGGPYGGGIVFTLPLP